MFRLTCAFKCAYASNGLSLHVKSSFTLVVFDVSNHPLIDS